MVPQLYQETKVKVREALTEATRIALTCDAWTTQSFVTFTEWQLESHVLQTRVTHESHTAMNAMFHSVADEWKLTVADLVIVRGNAANMFAAVQLENLTYVFCRYNHSCRSASSEAKFGVTAAWKDWANHLIPPLLHHR